MKKILLPTDFSVNADNAIDYAMQLYKNEDCTFYILNTYTPVIYDIEYVLASPGQFGLGDAIRQNSLESLDKTYNRIKKEKNNPKHKIETICSFNILISEIEDLIEKKSIDLIVMGTKGATGAKEILFGSNTVQVFKHVKCPVIAIPSDFSYENPHEILFPSDFEVSFEDYHLKPILDIATEHISRINILHVSYGEGLTEEQKANKAQLANYFKHVAFLFHNVKNDNVTDAINEFQIKAKINLLVMINNKHSFFENIFFRSTVNQIGFNLKVPFLVIPSKM